MTRDDRRSSSPTLLAAAEPTGRAGLASLIERLSAEGRLAGRARDGRAIDPAGLASCRRPRRHERLASGRSGVPVRGGPGPAHGRARPCRLGGRSRRRRRARRTGGPGVAAAPARGRCDPAGARDGRGLVVRRSEPRPADDRHHRHRRQDDDVLPRRRRPRGRRGADRDDRDGRPADRRRGRARTRSTRRPRTRRSSSAPFGRCASPATSRPSSRRRRTAWPSSGSGSVAYDVAILTNVTHEHLEFHGTWEAYRDAKLSLFERLARHRAGNPAKRWPKVGVVNADDPSAGRFIGGRPGRPAPASSPTGRIPAADVRATAIEEDGGASPHRLRRARAVAATLELRLAGRFNVHNALAVVRPGRGAGPRPGRRTRGARLGGRGVPGRMERVDLGQPFARHRRLRPQPGLAPDRARPARAGRGGPRRRRDRRSSARPASVTSRSARSWAGSRRSAAASSSSPTRTRAARTGRRSSKRSRVARRPPARSATGTCSLIADRRAAIAAAFERARPGDTVLLAGKGHERSIIGPDGPVAWDERAEAEAALRTLGYG